MNLTDFEQAVEYADIFQQRGHLYHAAMAFAPRARDAEFAQLFSKSRCSSSERIIDVPSGGGYLQNFLDRALGPRAVEVTPLEFSADFSSSPIVVDPYAEWPLERHAADRVICLAASHHVADLPSLLETIRLYIRKGGLIQVADVSPYSGIASFLDSFVDRHTATGHKGFYRDFGVFPWPEWLDVLSTETRACPWIFDSEMQLLRFCHGLFGLSESARPLLRDALMDNVGIETTERGVELRWELSYFEARARLD